MFIYRYISSYKQTKRVCSLQQEQFVIIDTSVLSLLVVLRPLMKADMCTRPDKSIRHLESTLDLNTRAKLQQDDSNHIHFIKLKSLERGTFMTHYIQSFAHDSLSPIRNY